MADNMSIDKNDPIKHDSEESMGSSPEAEQPTANNTQENQQPKRKGGRKPIYATSEERKQRNRQAQAAFRERRTEYIKQLEEAIRVHESNLHNLQAAHRTAADECLMLRYKNSLLERVLLEKGIDVQAELRAKTGSPNLGPTHVPQNMVQPPPIQRAIMNRHHQSRRSNSSIAPKLEPGVTPVAPPLHAHTSAPSPKNRATPSSHSNSPTSSAPAFGSQSAVSPTSSDPGAVRQTMAPGMKQQQQMSPLAPMGAANRSHMMAGPLRQQTNNNNNVPFYPTPGFQNHIEQLEQEYDAPADIMDEADLDTSSGPGPYPSAFSSDVSQPMITSPTTAGPSQQLSAQAEAVNGGQSSQPPYPSMTQLLDTGLDWDPFGLSASMAFPSQFTFDTSNMR